MKFRVTIARDRSEYGELVVEAPSIEAAEAGALRVLKEENDAPPDILNGVSWSNGDETTEERVIDAEEEEDDEEPDLVVPWAPMEREHADSCDGVLMPPVLEGSKLWICATCSFAVERS